MATAYRDGGVDEPVASQVRSLVYTHAMVIPLRAVMLSVSLISAAAGGALWMSRGADLLVWILLLCGVVGVIGTLLKRADGSGVIGEPDDVSQLSDQRRQQLIRGTSMHLRNMHYRYTVRVEHHDLSDRQCFNAEVNSLHLGFVPVVIGDSTTQKQDYGFVAFVFDGRRWLGPGLPCPGGRDRALQHALRCVSALDASDKSTS